MQKQMDATKKVIIGIDVGYALLGFSICEYDSCPLQNLHLKKYGTFSTPATQPYNQRLLSIFKKVQPFFEQVKLFYGCSNVIVSIEDLYSSKLTKISQARGVILLAAACQGLTTMDISPSQAKKIFTGNGYCPKSDIQAKVQEVFKIKEWVQDDAADAIAIACATFELIKEQNDKKKGTSFYFKKETANTPRKKTTRRKKTN